MTFVVHTLPPNRKLTVSKGLDHYPDSIESYQKAISILNNNSSATNVQQLRGQIDSALKKVMDKIMNRETMCVFSLTHVQKVKTAMCIL
jgi:hypothetical protein